MAFYVRFANVGLAERASVMSYIGLSAKTSLKAEVDLANGTVTPTDFFIRY